MKFLTRGNELLKSKPDFKLLGRERELEKLAAILMRDKANSILLVGSGGVGCSALCMGLQAMKDEPNAPFDIVSKRLFWLDVDALFNSENNDEISTNFNKVVSILRTTPDSILIIDDTRDFIEATRNHGVTHFINTLNSLVKNGETQIIFEVRDEDLDLVIKSHSDMRESYTMIDLGEPDATVLPEIVNGSVVGLTRHHGIKIEPEAVSTAIELTNKYRTRDPGLSRAQPERSVTLLDRALATYRLNAHKQHPDIPGLVMAKALMSTQAHKDEIQSKIDALNLEFASTQIEIKRLFKLQRDGESRVLELEEQIEVLKKQEEERRQNGEDIGQRKINASINMMNAGGYDSPAVTEVRNQISALQSVIAENRKQFEALTGAINSKLVLTKERILEEFSSISGIAVNKLNADEREKLKSLEAEIKNRIFGQDEAVHKLCNAVKIARVGRRGKGKPQASFMFLGPSGVGKTELAKALAASLNDDESTLTRFDMSEYMEKHAVAKLIGAPPGYEGFEAGGILTNAMRRNPNRILLFDEIEKAHDDVFNIFLQILDDGRLTDNVGRTVSFDESIILMTTNIGQTHFLDDKLSDEEIEMAVDNELRTRYRNEFLNRFAGRQNIVQFRKLELGAIEKIVRREINGLDKTYSEKGVRVMISDKCLNDFCKANYDPSIGARGLPGYIMSHLEPLIVDMILENSEIEGTMNITYDVKGGKFAYTFEPKEETNERSAA